MVFSLVALVGMFVGRKVGWFISRNFLYPLPKSTALLLCIIWGTIIAFLIHSLILWQNPNIIIKVILGYFLGAYVSMPNYGLINESTIPDEELSRHNMIKLIPVITYIVFTILFTFIR